MLEKISSYNLLNYLLPGTIFVCLAKYFTDYNLIQENIFIGAFLYYFIGMVISRFGSLIVEPILKSIMIVKFADFNNFVDASNKDSKIEKYLEDNNSYRTIIAMITLLLLIKAYNYFQDLYLFNSGVTQFLIIIIILVIFILSYRKQTNYTRMRIEADKQIEKS